MKKLLVIVLVCISTVNIFAQATTNASLKKLINESFVYFSKVKEVENAEIAAKEKIRLTELNKRPDINLNTSYNYMMPKISFPINGNEIQFAPINNIAGGVSTNYTLLDFGKLRSVIEGEKIELEYAKHNTQFVKTELANQVAMIYYSIVYFQKSLAIQDSIINYFKENIKIAENKFKNGDALKIDVLNLQASKDQEENKRIDLQNLLEKQISLLIFTTGLNISSGNEFDFEMEEIPASESFSIKNNPLFWLSQDKIDLTKKDLQRIKQNNNPLISLHANSGIKNGYVPEVNDLRFNYMGGVSLYLPLYGFGKIKQQIKVQETIIKQSELSKISLINNNKKDIEQVMIDIKYSKEKRKNIESQIDAAKMAEEITSSRYKNGVATYLDINMAATNIQKAYYAQLQNDYQLCVSKIALARLMGCIYWN